VKLSENLVDIRDAFEVFGRGWSPRSVTRRIQNGLLVEGKHYIDDAPSGSKLRLIKLVKPEIEKLRLIPRRQRR
jgi:hypothetical protein